LLSEFCANSKLVRADYAANEKFEFLSARNASEQLCAPFDATSSKETDQGMTMKGFNKTDFVAEAISCRELARILNKMA
jgi:hypothetical protein